MTTPLLLFIYALLMLALALIVRGAFRRYRDNGPNLRVEDLEREVRFPYTPPPERRKRSFEATTRHA